MCDCRIPAGEAGHAAAGIRGSAVSVCASPPPSQWVGEGEPEGNRMSTPHICWPFSHCLRLGQRFWLRNSGVRSAQPELHSAWSWLDSVYTNSDNWKFNLISVFSTVSHGLLGTEGGGGGGGVSLHTYTHTSDELVPGPAAPPSTCSLRGPHATWADCSRLSGRLDQSPAVPNSPDGLSGTVKQQNTVIA